MAIVPVPALPLPSWITATRPAAAQIGSMGFNTTLTALEITKDGGTTWEGFVNSITGTVNQISATAPDGNLTLSLPQDIATNSNVDFSVVSSLAMVTSIYTSLNGAPLEVIIGSPVVDTDANDMTLRASSGSISVGSSSAGRLNLLGGVGQGPLGNGSDIFFAGGEALDGGASGSVIFSAYEGNVLTEYMRANPNTLSIEVAKDIVVGDNATGGKKISFQGLPGTNNGGCATSYATWDNAGAAIATNDLVSPSLANDFTISPHPTAGTDTAIGVAMIDSGTTSEIEYCWTGDIQVRLEDGAAIIVGEAVVPSASQAGRIKVFAGTAQRVGVAWESQAANTPGNLVWIRLGISSSN